MNDLEHEERSESSGLRGPMQPSLPPGADMPAGLSDAAIRWLAENRDAIEAWDAWVEEHGLPLAELRTSYW